MGLETFAGIWSFNSAWPVGVSDLKSAGDDHLRGIKAAVLATFPNVTAAITATHAELNLLVGKTGTVWTSANDGAASGLDADTVDGSHASAFAAASHAHSAADITSGTLAVGRGGTGQTTAAAAEAALVLAGWTVQSDPGGTPSGTPGQVFAYY